MAKTGDHDVNPAASGRRALGKQRRDPILPRAAGGAVRPSTSLPPPERFEPLGISSRKRLAASRQEIVQRINREPAHSAMLLINPVLALKALGVQLRPEVAAHVLHSLQYPKALRDRIDELKQHLSPAFGDNPRPNDAVWLATALFTTLKLPPLDTKGRHAHYRAPLDAKRLEQLQALRPARRLRYPQTRLIARTSRLGIASPRPAARRFDLEAKLSVLPAIDSAPAAVRLHDLYFYKDVHPLARDLLELGMIQQQGFPYRTPSTFRRVRDGHTPNAFRAWIKAIRFPERDA